MSENDKTITECREEIKNVVANIEDERFLKFVYHLLLAFKKKWGI